MLRRLLPLSALLLPAALPAQGAVAGRLEIAERGGSPSKDLADAVVWLVPLTGSAIPATVGPAGAAATTTEIVMQGRQFSPRLRVVPVGSTVEFPNMDPFRHNAFSNSGAGPFDLGLYGKGERRGARLARAGVWTVYCDIHARMRAHVVAVPTTLFAQPAADGRFAIGAVPAGRYVLHAWHDRGGELRQELVVGAAGAPAIALRMDARGWVMAPHKNKFGRDYPTRSGERY